MALKTILATALLIGCWLPSFSQMQKTGTLYPTVELEEKGISPEKSDKEIMLTLFNELEGSYQVQISQPDYQIIYTRELMETIKSSRLVGQTASLVWDQFTTIIIFPAESNGHSETLQN